MAPIDPNNPAFGFDRPAFDSQAFLNGLGLDTDTPFNASNGLDHYEMPPELLKSFDECIASLPPDGLDQEFCFDQPISTTSVNYSAQPVASTLPVPAPYSQVSYDSSIGIPYTPEDTDADKVRKWENLIAHANLANAGIPPSAPQPIQEETIGQNPQTVDSPNSLFESPGSTSAEASSAEIVATPSATLSTPSSPQAPVATMAPSNTATNVTANAIPRAIPRTVKLPRALTNPKGYAQHVSPFAPVATINPPLDSGPNSRELENARSRIQSLAKERNYYQRSLRKATAIDPKTGKTSLQLLQAENANLRRVNSSQLHENEILKQQIEEARKSYASLVENYNSKIKQLHWARLELQQRGN